MVRRTSRGSPIQAVGRRPVRFDEEQGGKDRPGHGFRGSRRKGRRLYSRYHRGYLRGFPIWVGIVTGMTHGIKGLLLLRGQEEPDWRSAPGTNNPGTVDTIAYPPSASKGIRDSVSVKLES